MKLAAALFDLGDVIVQETTEVKDDEAATVRAELVPGIERVLRDLHARRVKLGLVADTHRKNPSNVLGRHGLYEFFDAFAISEELCTEKPDARMFRHALDTLGIAPENYRRVVMVGNRLDRDIAGANVLGLVSIWFHWNDRYPTIPRNDSEKPRFQVTNVNDLHNLLTEMADVGL